MTPSANRASRPDLSVVVPTFNRRAGLERLLRTLATQTYSAGRFEVVVVNDGSNDDTDEMLVELTTPYRLRVLNQPNEGPAAARNVGVQQARGRLVVFLDDDVVPLPDLLAAHVAAHGDADDLVVVGPMSPPTDWPRSVWVRWEERQLLKQYAAMARGQYSCTFRQFYTGNASVMRERILAAGGFDARFKRAEDVELAFRLWSQGARFVFEPRADTLHYAARSFSSWLRTPYQYGRYDVVMGREKDLHTFAIACQEFERRHAWSRWLARACVGKPWRRAAICGLAGVAVAADALGQGRVATFALSGIYNVQYWQGASDELGHPDLVWQAVAAPLTVVPALLRRG
ncbi:MAG: glycosyltransferase family 2 protein [Chloroflexi bacterium]|nr:glycosyltransferase family 2 protein [Chloroflexota bacterium]